MAIMQAKDYFPAKPSCRSEFRILKSINEKLSKQNKALFNKSCFGHFMKMVGTQTQFQGQLYLHLLFKQGKSLREDKLVFHLNNSELEFGPREFALITGLHFGPLPEIPSSSKFFKKVWGKRNPEHLVIQDIEDAFGDEIHKGDGEISLKLALLWVLYGILLPNEKTMKRNDMEYIHLVDNLDDFNRFPWGRVGYQLLVKNTTKCMAYTWFPRKVSSGKKSREYRKSIDLHGFPHALQFWSYKAIEWVCSYCATQISKDVIPRMLRWEAPKFFRFDTLTTYCFPTKMARGGVQTKVHANLIPSTEEEKTSYYRSVLAWEEIESGSNNAAYTPTFKRKMNDALDEEDSYDDNSPHDDDINSAQVNNKPQKSSVENTQMKELIGDVQKLNVKHKMIDCKLDCILENQKIIMAKLGDSEEDNEIKMLQLGVADDDATEDNNSRCDDYDEIDAYITSDDNTHQHEPILHVDQHNNYNPLSIEFPSGAESVFMKWFTSKKSGCIRVSVGDYPMTNKEWFKRIWDPRGWLCSENVDALMYLVVYKAKKWPTLFLQRWTVVDLMFWGHITGGIFKNWLKGSKKARANFDWANKEKFIAEYVIGAYPLNGHCMPWGEADRVFGVAHVNKNHWVLYEINILDEVITVYDSLYGGGRRPNPRHMADFRKLAMLMPSITKNLIKGGESTENKKSWELKLCPDTPQQMDSDSCGVFCIKMLECLVCGLNVGQIVLKMSDLYRKKYYFELFRDDNIQLI